MCQVIYVTDLPGLNKIAMRVVARQMEQHGTNDLDAFAVDSLHGEAHRDKVHIIHAKLVKDVDTSKAALAASVSHGLNPSQSWLR